MNHLRILLLHRLRRDRWQLAVWIAGIGLLGFFAATAVAQTYGDDAGREGIIRLAVANPAILMLRGLPQGTGLDAFVFFQIFTFLALMAGLMSTFLAVRHSRAEEESGRAELLAATPASRNLPTIATLLHGFLANVVLCVAVAAGFIAGGLDPHGSLLAGAAVAATGLAFLGFGLLAAQFLRSGRGANAVSTSAVVLAYLLRGLGDALGTPHPDGVHMTAAWPSWFSPIGWEQQTAAYTANNPAPLLLGIGFAAVCAASVFALQSRRDSGASLLPERAGRTNARPALSGSFGLAWRLQWPTLIGWCVGSAAAGLLAGSLAKLVEQAAGTAPTLGEALRSLVPAGALPLSQVLISVMFSMVGVLAAACAVQAIVRMRQEENSRTAELILSTPVSRVRWLRDYLFLGALSVVLVLLSGAVVSATSALASGDLPERVGDSFIAAAVQLPAALIYLAAVALVFVLLPEMTAALGWSLLGFGAFLGIFGGLIGAPEALRNLSPFTHTPIPAGSDTDISGGLWMLAIAAAAAATSVLAMRRRGLHAT